MHTLPQKSSLQGPNSACIYLLWKEKDYGTQINLFRRNQSQRVLRETMITRNAITIVKMEVARIGFGYFIMEL